jgi:hypothetical protein
MAGEASYSHPHELTDEAAAATAQANARPPIGKKYPDLLRDCVLFARRLVGGHCGRALPIGMPIAGTAARAKGTAA